MEALNIYRPGPRVDRSFANSKSIKGNKNKKKSNCIHPNILFNPLGFPFRGSEKKNKKNLQTSADKNFLNSISTDNRIGRVLMETSDGSRFMNSSMLGRIIT
ncbi:hypothetical protein OUZ56_030778 [Daphnia magna]|uniref:Uncharacterized protein n=1 Tax=Daphnia magna TaxID=35525 RepID=A0ABQ9ZTK2_9CRUS|nr:hypothetical protein OUZ56_030778 [Daphnia magna]